MLTQVKDDMNNIEIIGNLGKDPVLRYAASGSSYVYFEVADNSHKREHPKCKTQWWDCVAFGTLAEDIALMKKGQVIHILQGKVEDKQDRSKKQCVVYKLTSEPMRKHEEPSPSVIEDDDVPF